MVAQDSNADWPTLRYVECGKTYAHENAPQLCTAPAGTTFYAGRAMDMPPWLDHV